jgi:hypothetical protein
MTASAISYVGGQQGNETLADAASLPQRAAAQFTAGAVKVIAHARAIDLI